jgi:hypothetical protein
MVYDGILFALIVGFIRGGNLKGISDLKFKWGWVFPILLLVQFTVFYFQNKNTLVASLSEWIFILVYIIGMFFLWQNRHYKGVYLILLGVGLNFIVMAVNGGRMPVSLEAASILDPMYADAIINGLYGKHAVLTNSTNLGFLGDIIPLTDPYPRDQVISIGDVVMNIGIFFFIQYLMLLNKKVDVNKTTSLQA